MKEENIPQYAEHYAHRSAALQRADPGRNLSVLSNRTWQALENEASYLLAALNRYEEDEEYLRQIPATCGKPPA